MSGFAFVYLSLLAAPVALLFVRTTPVVKWLAIGLAALFFVGTWYEAAPAEADLPPCHMMLPCTFWAAVGYRHWFYPRRRRFPPGHCRQCGYDLTGSTSGACPECGERV